MFTRPEYRNAGFEGTITNTFREGVRVAGRLYKFLAFSNSSLKEGRFLFFHEPTDGSATVESIRIWMGDFSHIRCPARYAARMAQALSSTIPTIDMEGNQVAMHCPDVKRNGYTFSDGVGTVSPDLADAIWDSLRAGRTHVAVHQTKEREAATPSAFQIRFGGAKGMISVDLNLHGRRMRLRKSMIKFEAPNCTILEIAGHALSWRNAYLNRQIILILEDLGVPAKVFLDIQRDCIRELQLMQTDQHKVLDMAGNIGHFGNFVRMIATVGVVNWMQNEFIQASLDHVRLYFLKEIKYRARMKIPDGAWTLFGVLDETGTLKEGEVFVQLFDPDSPSDNKILKGPVMVFRSPCLHPGDCQPATAVEVPALHHLRNVVVFSQNG
ncbi:RNA-dependent RNA polymerase, partial [Chytriomyces sp. MP71]